MTRTIMRRAHEDTGIGVTPPIPMPQQMIERVLNHDALLLLERAYHQGAFVIEKNEMLPVVDRLIDAGYIARGVGSTFVITMAGRREQERISKREPLPEPQIIPSSSTNGLHEQLRKAERDLAAARQLSETRRLDAVAWERLAEDRKKIIADMEERHRRAIEMIGTSAEAAALRLELQQMTELAESRQRRIDELTGKTS